MDCSLCPCQTVLSDLGKLGDHTSIAIFASWRMHVSALSRMRHWIWLSVAPRLCGRWCHALMVSRERSSAPRGSGKWQVSGKTFLLFCTSHVTSGSGLDSIPMKHRRSVLFGSTLTVLCSILPDLSRWVRNSISLQICPVFYPDRVLSPESLWIKKSSKNTVSLWGKCRVVPQKGFSTLVPFIFVDTKIRPAVFFWQQRFVKRPACYSLNVSRLY